MIYNIQILRLIAAYTIIIAHLFGINNSILLIGSRTDVLRAGTDLFMVCSAFLTLLVVNDKSKQVKRFILDRAVRIFPLYWVLTVTIALTGIAPMLYGSAIVTPESIAKSLLLIPYENDGRGVFPIIRIAWTLIYIFEFTLIVSISLLLSRKWTPLISSFIIVTLVVIGQTTPSLSAELRFLTSPVLIDFVWGALVFVAFSAIRSTNQPQPLLVCVGLMGVIVSLVWVYAGAAHWETPSRSIALGLPAALLLVSALILERGGARLKSGFLSSWTKITYALYLTHMFAVGAILKVWQLVPLRHPAFDATLILTAMVGASAMAWLVYRWVEKPMTNALLRRLPQTKG